MDRIFCVHANPTKVVKISCNFWLSAEVLSADSNGAGNTEDELALGKEKHSTDVVKPGT